MKAKMEIRDSMSFTDLQARCWSRAEDTLAAVAAAGLEDELIYHLEDYFEYDVPSLEDVNGYLGTYDEILEALGIEEFYVED